MSFKINEDVDRFKNIVKNKVKNNLGKYISSHHLIGQQGAKTIKIPIHSIDLPRFTYGSLDGTGQGEGNEGDPMDGSGKPGKGKAGSDTGEHGYSAEFTPAELANILQEELQLPNVDEKGKGKVVSSKNRYNDINKVGAEGLRHFRRTYKEALKRTIASGNYNAQDPKVIPIKEDKRYRSASPIEEPSINTSIIFLMDISGSMGDFQRHMAKSIVFWTELWLTSQYKGIESRFLVHDVACKEVSREEFFTISEAGGTQISPAYEHCIKMMKEEYPFSEWNVYFCHLTDSDNLGQSDNEKCLELIKQEILPNCNLFCYGHIRSEGGWGEFLDYIEKIEREDKVSLSKISSEEDVLKTIKKFFGKGK